MDFVISVCCFRDPLSKPIIKELAVLAVDRNHIGHWITSPPCAFTDLPIRVQEYNNYVSSKISGIEWFEGDISHRQLYSNLRAITRTARTLYTYDEQNAKLLGSITTRNVVDLSKMGLGISSLSCKNIFCYYHGSISGEGRYLCALTEAENIKNWLLQQNIRPQSSNFVSYDINNQENGYLANSGNIEQTENSVEWGVSSG